VQRNVASQKVTLLAIDTSTNAPKTGDAANLTAYVSKDDGAVTVLGDTSATELDATNAPGLYAFDLTQGETDAVKLVFSGKSSTSNVKLIPLLVYTRPSGFSTLTIANACVDADVERFAGTAGTFSGGRPEVNTSHWAGTAVASANVLIDGAITAAKIATDAITSAKVADGFLTAAKFAAGAFDAVWTVTTRELSAFSASFKTGYALSSAGVQAIWDALTSALTTVGSIGKLLVDNVNATIGSRASQTSLDTVDDFLDTEVAAILAAVDTEIASIISTLGTPAGASIAADLVTIDNFVDDLEGRLTAALADKLTKHAAAVLALVVGSGSTTTTVKFSTVEGGAPSATDDFYNGAVIVFTSGTLSGQRVEITDYVGSTTTATISAATSAPASGVTGVIV